MGSKRVGWWLGVLAVGVLGLCFRLGYQTQSVFGDPVRADASQYVSIAWNMLHHGVVSTAPPSEAVPAPDSYRGPGYPALVAVAVTLGGEGEGWYPWLLLLQAMLGGLTAMLTVMTARSWLPPVHALAAGVLVALWPHMVTLSGYVLTETLFAFLLALSVYLFSRGLRGGGMAWHLGAGLAFGGAALVNPVITPFPLLGAAYLALLSRRREALVFVLVALMLPAAWALRSAGLETATAATSNGRLMENVLIGLEPDFDSFSRGSLVGLAAAQRVQTQLEVYRRDKAQAWRNVAGRLAARPAFYLQWYFLQKPPLFWSWSIGQGAGDIYVYPMIRSAFETKTVYRTVAALARGLNPLFTVAAFAMVALLLVRAGRGQWRHEPVLIVVALMFLYATAVHSLLAPDVRYSTPFRPFEMLLLVTVASSVQQLLRRRRAVATPVSPEVAG